MSEGALILFVKHPVPGKVKTRIAATAGANMALRIYRALLQKLWETAEKLPYTCYAYFGEAAPQEAQWPSPHFAKRLQTGADIGERMYRAFDEVLKAHNHAVLVGSDVPGISPAIIGQAFGALRTHDAAVGPAADGGYYLLGLKEAWPDIFSGIEWSTSSVFAQTTKRLTEMNRRYRVLPTLADIDTEADWLQHGWELP